MIAHPLKESELLEHVKTFGCPLELGTRELQRYIETSWISSSIELKKRQATLISLRDRNSALTDAILEELPGLKAAEEIILAHKQTETSKVAEGQIFFTGSATKTFNAIPFVLAICVMLKVYIAPFLALLTPLILCIMPYVILTTVMEMQLTWDMYVQMMKQMVLGIQGGEPWRAKHYVQAFWTLTSVGQGMVQPFITAYHTANLDEKVCERGRAIIQLASFGKKWIHEFRERGLYTKNLDIPEVPGEPRQAAAWIDDEPLGLQTITRIVGQICWMATIAHDRRWLPVDFIDKADNKLILRDIHDLAINPERAKVSHLDLRNHSVLTGPNRGGKSSLLRGTLQAVILGQTIGFTRDANGEWKPFHSIYTRLKSLDTAGKESLFEMEVRFASQILKGLRERRHTLVLIDELFHSTNPPDAEVAARVFVGDLWRVPYCKSIISTHSFSLAEEGLEKGIQTICCPASEDAGGKIHYTYSLQNGICRVSSVREVLREAGLRA
jgi:hypothetical protein